MCYQCYIYYNNARTSHKVYRFTAMPTLKQPIRILKQPFTVALKSLKGYRMKAVRPPAVKRGFCEGCKQTLKMAVKQTSEALVGSGQRLKDCEMQCSSLRNSFGIGRFFRSGREAKRSERNGSEQTFLRAVSAGTNRTTCSTPRQHHARSGKACSAMSYFLHR